MLTCSGAALLEEVDLEDAVLQLDRGAVVHAIFERERRRGVERRLLAGGMGRRRFVVLRCERRLGLSVGSGDLLGGAADRRRLIGVERGAAVAADQDERHDQRDRADDLRS